MKRANVEVSQKEMKLRNHLVVIGPRVRTT